jgi:hypothetical protein
MYRRYTTAEYARPCIRAIRSTKTPVSCRAARVADAVAVVNSETTGDLSTTATDVATAMRDLARTRSTVGFATIVERIVLVIVEATVATTTDAALSSRMIVGATEAETLVVTTSRVLAIFRITFGTTTDVAVIVRVVERTTDEATTVVTVNILVGNGAIFALVLAIAVRVRVTMF